MLGRGTLFTLACACALLFTSSAQAQVPCSVGFNPTAYECTVSGEAANRPVLVDCRDRSTPVYATYVRGCHIVVGTGTFDVSRCESTSDPGTVTQTCRTAAWDAGYDCSARYWGEGDAADRRSYGDRYCTTKAGRLGVAVSSACEDHLEIRHQFEVLVSQTYEDSCTTTVTTPLAQLRCTHDPAVPIDVFFRPEAILFGTEAPDQTPSCVRA